MTVGAFAIVSLAPREKPIVVVKDALLMESATATRQAESAPLPPQATLSELPPPRSQEAVQRNDPAIVSPPRSPDRAQDAPDAHPDAPPAVDAAPPASRKPHRQTLAALPPVVRPPDSAPPPPMRVPAPPVERRIEGVLSASDIRHLRLSLRLTREQMPFWPPVEQALLEIGAQQAALARSGQDPKNAFGFGSAMHIFSVARPLLDVLREDQKAMVRERARTMGFGSIASSI